MKGFPCGGTGALHLPFKCPRAETNSPASCSCRVRVDLAAWQTLETQLWVHAADVLRLGMHEPATLVRLLKIVHVQEAVDAHLAAVRGAPPTHQPGALSPPPSPLARRRSQRYHEGAAE